MTAVNPPMPADGGEFLNVVISWEGSPWPDPAATQTMGRHAVHAAFDAAKGHSLLAAGSAGAELGLVFADNAFVQTLNGFWRGRDMTTNVLAFPAMDEIPVPGAPVLLGDVVVAREIVLSEARSQNKPFHHHLAHLVCHGTLHLLQYDHMTDTDACTMESLERAILADLGIPDPYTPLTP